jgi:hypothetical protein
MTSLGGGAGKPRKAEEVPAKKVVLKKEDVTVIVLAALTPRLIVDDGI